MTFNARFAITVNYRTELRDQTKKSDMTLNYGSTSVVTIN